MTTPTISMSLKLKGFKSFDKVLDQSKFNRVLAKHGMRATRKNALLLEKALRTTIRQGVSPELARLTILIKGSRKPLVDFGDLFQSITSHIRSWQSAFIGVLKTHADYNIFVTLHEGQAIRVTQKMRTMFFYLWKASYAEREGKPLPRLSSRAHELFERFRGKIWYRLRDDTEIIVIPGRPFVVDTLASRALKNQVRRNYVAAVEAALAEHVGAHRGGP